MPETPDFDKIAESHFEDPDANRARVSFIAEELREMWNARGAADAEAVQERLATLTGWVASEPYRQQLREAIEALNRR